MLAAAGCNGQGASKAGGAPEAAPDGTITLSFASADQLPVDTTFATLVAKDSGGHLKLHTSYYNGRSTSVDVQLAAALAAGKLDVGDVASRAWESQGIEAFRAYQVPFLVTSRSLLDRAVTVPVAAGLLAALKPAKLTGLAIVPTGIRYLLSTRPLTTPAQFYGAKIRINDSTTSSEVITALGATPVTNIASGPAAVQALRDGKLTAIETDPVNAMHGRLPAGRAVRAGQRAAVRQDHDARGLLRGPGQAARRRRRLAAGGRRAGRGQPGGQHLGPGGLGLDVRAGR